MFFRIAAAGLIAGAGFAFLVQPAAADEPVETAIKGWVASMDASQDWQAGYKSLTYDATSRQATLSGLTIRSRIPGADVSFDTVVVTGYSAAGDGGFTADRVTADGGTLDLGPFKLALSDAEINALVMPALPGVAWDPKRPFTSIIKAYAPLTRLAVANARLGSLGLIENNNGVNSRIVYDQVRVDRWSGGKIAAVTAGPITMESPNPDGVMTMKVGSFETRDIDIDATLRVFDPDRYAGGSGDGVWHQVTGLAAYHDFDVAGPGIKLTMTLLSLEGFKLRQPRHPFADLLDQTLANPNAPTTNPEAAIDMLSAYGLGRMGISGLDIAAAGIKSFHLGGFSISDLSVDRLGEIAVDDYAGEIEDVGGLKLGHFALGNVVLPGADALRQAVAESQANGGNANVAGLAPKPGFVEMSGLEVSPAGGPHVSLDKARVDLADYIGPVPTTVSADISHLIMPASALRPSDQAVLAKLGYDTLDLDYSLKANWDAANESVNVDRFNFSLKDAGGLDLSMVLAGLPRQAIENPQSLRDALPKLSLKKATLTFKDDSIVGKGLDMLAEKMHAQPDKFRQQFADAMPLLLSLFVLHDPKVATLVRQSGILATLAPAVKAFVGAPGSSITVALAPPTPILFPAISAAADKEPASLISMLGMTVESSAQAEPQNGGTQVPVPPAGTPPGGGGQPAAPSK